MSIDKDLRFLIKIMNDFLMKVFDKITKLLFFILLV